MFFSLWRYIAPPEICNPLYPQTPLPPIHPRILFIKPSNDLYAKALTRPPFTARSPVMPPSNPNYSSASAPLPSPTASEKRNQSFPSHSQHRHRSSNNISQQQQAATFYPQHQQSSAASQAFHPQQQPGQVEAQKQSQLQNQHNPYGSASKDFCVIAEAAKRAELACMMRDFGDIGI